MSEFIEVAKRADLVPGKPLKVVVKGKSILICANGEEVFAIENRCSHAEEPLECGRIRLGWISCPLHGARFDLASGAPLNPPAQEPIKTYRVTVMRDVIMVALRDAV